MEASERNGECMHVQSLMWSVEELDDEECTSMALTRKLLGGREMSQQNVFNWVDDALTALKEQSRMHLLFSYLGSQNKDDARYISV